MQSRITDFRTIEVGDPVEFPPIRGILGSELLSPIWHALLVPPRKERSTREILREAGQFAFFNERETVRHRFGRKTVFKRPIVPRLVYARFKRAPQFDVMKARGIITGVFSRGGVPICLPRGIVRAIHGLSVAYEELEAAKAELAALKPGDRAEIIEGPLAGVLVDVDRVKDGRVWWSTAIGLKGEVAELAVAKSGY